MKFKLMIQSLSPLALLTIIRNFSFVTTNSEGIKLNFKEFFVENLVLLIVLLFCLIWIILAVAFFINFGAFKWNNKESGFQVCNVVENEDASLNFFLTLIIPLLIDDVETIQGALTFVCIVLLICRLLYKTSLFYANPVLALLGYRIYEFSFEDNPLYRKDKYIGLCKGTLKNGQSVEYKEITDKVIYIKGV
jgi:hypothetical protein